MADNYEAVPYIDTPFADLDKSRLDNIDFLRSGVTLKMSVPAKNGGMKFSRSMLNSVGYFSTLGAYLDRIGYPYGSDVRKTAEKAVEIGGFPKGAILCTENDGYFREYVSLEDNNMSPLPIEADDGTYEGNEHWGPTIPKVANFFPDYSMAVEKKTLSISFNAEATQRYVIDEGGWYDFRLLFMGSSWNAQKMEKARCEVRVLTSTGLGIRLGTIEGKLATKLMVSGSLKKQEMPVSSLILPLSKNSTIYITNNNALNVTNDHVYLFYSARIQIMRFGESML